MLIEYIQAALEKTRYEIIEDDEPYYVEVPELEGVWATGNTLEACRKNLEEVIDEWIVFLLRRGLMLLPIGNHVIKDSGEIAVV